MAKTGNIFQTKRRTAAFMPLLCFVLSFVFISSNALADMPAFKGISCGYTDNRIDSTFEVFEYDTDAQKQSKQNAKQALDNVNNYCQKLKGLFKEEKDSIERDTGFWGIFGGDSEAEFKAKFDAFLKKHPSVENEYNRLLTEFQTAKQNYDQTEEENKKDIEEGIASGKYVACGETHPRGCPSGQQCYQYIPTGSQVHVGAGGSGATVHNISKFDCFEEGKAGKDWYLQENGSGNRGSSHTTIAPGFTQKISSDAARNVTIDETVLGQEVPKVSKLTNDTCEIDKMEARYQSSCYSCLVIKTLLEKFIAAAVKTNDLCRKAGVQILLIATLLWAAFWGINTISSLASLEPASMVNTLLLQGFKILFAYVVIESGVDVFLIYVVDPILIAGADFGTALLNGTESQLNFTPSPDYTYGGVEFLSADLMNKVLGFTESLDRVASTNLVIGHALTCHATHAGAWINSTIVGFHFIFPNIWIWLCGAVIWFAGFMLVLAVGYYLLDMSFKIGIAIMAFPVLMGLWPFSLTSGKVMSCVKTILTSAATFAFLAITTSYGMSMISVSLRDIATLKQEIARGNSIWVSETFDITGPYFLIILFAYFYSFLLVGSTIKEYVNKFFGGGIAANAMPMHSEMTRMTDIAKKATVGAAKVAGGAVAGGAGKVVGAAADATLGRAYRFVTSKFKKEDGSRGNAGTAGGNAGTAVRQSGRAVKRGGQAVQAGGRAMQAGGQVAAQAGSGIRKGGQGMMSAGMNLCGYGYGLGAIIGVPLMLAGAATYAGGAAVQATGKAVQATGKVVKASGKAMKKTGETIERAGKKMEKFGQRLKFGRQDSSASQNNGGQNQNTPNDQNNGRQNPNTPDNQN